LIIGLQRAFTPEEMGKRECGLCCRDFRVEPIVVSAFTDHHREIGRICRDCVEHFGRINPETFPTIEEYQEFLERYPEPIWPTGEAFERAEEDGTSEAAYEKSWVWRTPA
jgi:hypothetical protein